MSEKLRQANAPTTDDVGFAADWFLSALNNWFLKFSMTCASSAEIGGLKASVCFAESKELRGGLDHRRAGARIAEFASPERKCSPPTLASGSQLSGNHEEAADESDSRRANEAENSTRGTPV